MSLPVEIIALAAVALIGFLVGRLLGRNEPPPALPPVATSASREAEARFEHLIRSLTVGVIVVDIRGVVTTVNPAAAAIFPMATRRIVGRAIIEVIPSFDLDRRVHEALDGHPSRGTIDVGALGEPRILTVTTLPIDGKKGVIVVATDETKVHELEKTRRDFITSVSHELRTPLSSIKLMTETLLENAADAQAREMFLPRIKQEVDRVVQLVEDLLELARAESGRLRLRREDVDLLAVASQILRTFEPRASLLDVHLRAMGEGVQVHVDRHRIAQVVVNLVDNALRHTHAGGHVNVRVRADDVQAYLIVEDTGAGIPHNDLPHIFERFYVVDRSRAREAGGTGLGLSIVKGIVEAHGGSVQAESEYGVGSTFTCTFPRALTHDLNPRITVA